MSAQSMSAVTLPDEPFRGLDSQRFVDRAIFAGRKEETATLLTKLTLYRAVALYGETGTGKSSLINAGVLPRILTENYVADRIRIQPFPEREIKIERIRLSDDETAGYLPSNFMPQSDDQGTELASAGFELSLSAFKSQVRQMRSSPRPGAARSLDLRQRPRRALFIFDQFEEVITLFQDARRNANPAEGDKAEVYLARTQRAVLVDLIRMMRDQRLPIKILLAFREDYLAKLSLFFDHCPEVLSQAQRLVPPQPKELPEIIQAPFASDFLRSHFIQNQASVRSEIDEALAREIADRLTRRGEPDAAILTELQIVCKRLWQSANPQLLFTRKGIDGLIRDYLTEVFEDFPEPLADPAIALLAQMLTNSNTRNIVSEDDLLDRTSAREHIPRERLTEALKLLAGSRMVRREPRRHLHIYEITSEYLVPWIKERVGARKAIVFQKVAKERRRRLKMQRRRTKLFQRLVVFLGALLLGLITVTAFAGYQYKKLVQARREQSQAEQSRMAADAKLAEIQRQKIRYETAFKVIVGATDEEKEKAIAQIGEWIKQKDFPPELMLMLTFAQSKTDSARLQNALAKVLAPAVQTDPNLEQSIITAAEANKGLAEKLPPRFYIHIADDSQRPAAQEVARALREQGWVVPGIQLITGFAPDWDNELRYFQKSAETIPSIHDILTILKTTGGNWVDKFAASYASSSKVGPGYYEIWFAAPTGKLFVSLLDDKGKTLRGVKITLRFFPHDAIGLQFSRSRKGPGFIDVPPGNYDVTISVPGYNEQSLNLLIEAGQQVRWADVTLRKVGDGP